jgi:DNA-binding transcriptional MerR regulator
MTEEIKFSRRDIQSFLDARELLEAPPTPASREFERIAREHYARLRRRMEETTRQRLGLTPDPRLQALDHRSQDHDPGRLGHPFRFGA